MNTTLNKIKAHSPCEDGWRKLLDYLGKTEADDEPLPLLTILESNGIKDAIWSLRTCEDEQAVRLFACYCAESMLHIFEKEHPNDDRPRKAIETSRKFANGKATKYKLEAAWATAWAAARAAADAAMAAARDAAEVEFHSAASAASVVRAADAARAAADAAMAAMGARAAAAADAAMAAMGAADNAVDAVEFAAYAAYASRSAYASRVARADARAAQQEKHAQIFKKYFG